MGRANWLLFHYPSICQTFCWILHQIHNIRHNGPVCWIWPASTVMIAYSFLQFIHLCFPFISHPVSCLSPINCISFILFYLHDPGAIHSILEYSSWNIPLYYQSFYRLLPPSLFLVILHTIKVYKSHSSSLLFPMLVYLELLASIHLLVAPPRLC